MFCTNCGKENRDGQKFCQYCGAPLEPAAAGKKPGFRLRPVYWVLIGEIALAAAGIVLGWKVCRERFSAGHTAEIYAKALEEGNWGEAYDCLLIDEETGLSREEYIAAREAAPDTQMDQVSVEELSGGKNLYTGQLNPEAGAPSGEVHLELRYRSGGDTKSSLLTAVSAGKKWFFFDEWKILPSNLYGEDVEIRVPKQALLILNGEEIGRDTLQKTEGEETYDTYLLPNLFYGGYQIQLVQEGMETWTRLVEYSGNAAEFDFSDICLQPDQDTVDTLLQLYGEAGQAYFSAAMNGGSFSGLEQYFAGEALEQGSLEEEFQDVQEGIYDAKDGYGTISVEISDLQAESAPADTYYDSRPGDVILNLRGTVAVTSGSGSGLPREAGGEREWPEPVCFRMEDGVWKICNPQFQELIH